MNIETKINHIKEYMKNNVVIISFSGMHGCGKTTMLDYLCEVLEINKMIEQARCFLPLLNTGNISDFEFQYNTEKMYLTSWKNLKEQNKSFLCDRIYNDNIVYAQVTLDNFVDFKFDFLRYDLIINLNELPIDTSKDRRAFSAETENKIRLGLGNMLKEYENRGVNVLRVDSDDFLTRFEIIINKLYNVFCCFEGVI